MADEKLIGGIKKFNVKIKSRVSTKSIGIQISGHRQHHHASTNLLDVSASDHKKICKFAKTDGDKNMVNDALYVEFIDGSTYLLKGWCD